VPSIRRASELFRCLLASWKRRGQSPVGKGTVPLTFLHERRVAVIEAIEGEREQLLARRDHRCGTVWCGAENVERATVMISAANRSQLVFQGFRPFPMGGQQGGPGGVPPAEHEGEMVRVPVGSAGGVRDE